MNDSEYRPKKSAFILKRVAPVGILVFILSVAAAVVAVGVDGAVAAATFIILLLVIVGVIYVSASVAFGKQLYRFDDQGIYYKTGTLFSDRETELRYQNITHVRVVRPFLEYRLFGTGKILIESAGSSGTEVLMQSIARPLEVYAQLQRVMARNGFQLTYDNLLLQKQPAKIAVVLEIFGSIVAFIFFAFLFLLDSGVSLATLEQIPLILGIFVLMPILLGLGVYIFVHYQDLMRRTYTIYEDVITYNNGFLTRQDAFIPMENLSDSRVTQKFIDKLLNLHEVVISCQGSGSEITFRNLSHGEEVEQTIDRLINQTQAPADSAEYSSQTNGQPEGGQDDQEQAAMSAPGTPEVTDETQRTFKMHTPRALISYVFLGPFIIFAIPGMIGKYLAAKQTDFTVTANSVGSNYTLFTTKNVEFSRDKITGLVMKRNLLDRMYGTCTAMFWSIGSDTAVTFSHIKDEDGLESLLKRKAGIPEDGEMSLVKPQFGVVDMFRAHLGTAVFWLLVFAGALIGTLWSGWFLLGCGAIVLGAFVTALVLRRRYRRAWLRLGEHTISMGIGWLRRRHYYVLYDNVKEVSVTKYPGIAKGQVWLNIAGQQLVQRGSQKVRKSNGFGLGYIQGSGGTLDILDNLLDLTLLHRHNYPGYEELIARIRDHGPHVFRESKPSLKNGLVPIIVIHVLSVALVPLLIVTIPLYVIPIRRMSYHIEGYRVLRRSGVIYRKQTSIIFPRLDYIKSGQNFSNKLFKNGNLYLYTAGSSSAELTLSNMPDYTEFHQELKNQYQQG